MNSGMNIELATDKEGVRLPVQVQPKAKKNAITGVHNGRLKVAVTAPPERGKANTAVLKVLAAALKIPRSQLELVSGAASRAKTIRVSVCSAEEINRRLQSVSE